VRRRRSLRLDAASSYAMLVNTPSAEVPSLMRVSPGNPDASYIIQKLEGHAAVRRADAARRAVPAAIDHRWIRQWIPTARNRLPPPRQRKRDESAGHRADDGPGATAGAA